MAPSLDDYTRRHPHFLVDRVPRLLADTAQPGVIADLGCGDGRMIGALANVGLLGDRTYAVDLSPDRVKRAEASAHGVLGIVADATNVPAIPDGSCDGVLSSQVIEHLPNDRALASEVARILRPGGWWYVSSVLRGKRSWWIYRRDGARWLDPTHVREYASIDAFLAALAHPVLTVEQTASDRFRYPVLELAARMGHRVGLPTPRRVPARWLKISPPGYWMVEAAGRKGSDSARSAAGQSSGS